MRGMSKKDALACQVSLGLFAGLLGIASTAHGAPIADGVRAGGATINQSGTTTNITGGPNNVIGWKDFSVKNGESVVFDGGAKTNNYLNVVTGKVTSRIDGSITGGNNVYIANTNGVVFGETASVNVGNLYVTTRAVDVDAIGTAVTGGATLASQESSIIHTTAAAAPNTAKAEIVSLVDGTGRSIAANKIVLEGQSVRILNSANITATTDVQISVSEAQKEFQKKGLGGIVTTEGTRDKGYIHVGSTTGGTAPTSYHGNLAVEGFKLVSTPQELEDMKNDLAGKYMLKNDIDLSSTTHTPIGDHNAAFTGKFDGMFHEVKNMTLGAGTAADHAGLFGNINGAVVMNVGIKNANLSSLEYGGAVVGKAENSHIFNVYNESTSMIGSTGSSATNAGGVVGWLKNSTLDTAYNTSDVGKQAGGLVGNLDYSQIMDAYNTGAVQVNTGTNINESWGGYATGQGTTSILHNVYLKNNGAAAAGGNDLSMSVQGSYQIDGANKNKLLKGTDEKDAFSATSYSTWDIAADGGENKTWRIFDGHSLPLLTAFMQGAVQAEYAYADFQQAGHAHSGNTASTYTVQAADKQTDGSYVTRAGKESNDGKSISRVYNADYLKIAKKNGDGSYSAITDVNDTDLKLYGADDRSLVQLSQGTAGGGRRNAGSNAAYDGANGKGGREAMLYGGQHGYDIAGANVTIGKRKVIGSVNNMGKIEREYDSTADASAQFAAAIKTGNVSLRTDGLVDGDGASVNFTNNNAVTFRQAWTSTSAESPDVGYDKPVYVNGTLVQFTSPTGDKENYEFDASAINALNLKGNITQRKITATLNPATGINKVYDGDTDVKGAAYIPTATNNVLTFANTVGSDNVGNLLDDTDIKGKYRTGDSNANPGTETKNAGTHGVAYSGIKLKGANKHNYKLVDGSGNILYREAVTGETTTDAVVTSGTIWGKGEIKRRNISADTFLWNGIGTVSKVYDGTTEFDNAANKTITAKKKGDPGVNLNEGLIAGDAAKVKFEIAGKGEFRKSDGTTPTANVAEAAKAAYKLTATNTTSEDVLSNYKIGGVEAASGGKYDVTSAGKITPRVIDVQLLKATGIDKTYDGTVDAVEGDDGHKYLTMGKTWVGYAGTGRLVGDTNDSGIGTDGAKVKVTATYRQHGTTTNDKNVVRAADKSVIENGKDVYYTFKLEGGNAATNYTFNSDGTTPQAEKYATGMGTITPKKLTLASPGNVTRDYDGTSKVYKSQLPASYTTVTDGVESGDTVHLDFGTSDEVGTYYTDNTMATEAQDANVTTGGAHISGTPQNYTVKYTFTPTLDNGNYEVDGTTPPTGEGKIRQLGLTDANFEMDFDDREKVFDGQDTANIGNDLTSLKVKKGSETIFDFTTNPNSYEITGKYDNTHANLGRGAFGSRNLLTGKNAYNVTYKVKFQGQNLKNYDFSKLSPPYSTLYTWDSSEQTVSRTKQVGYIRQKEVVASIVNPKVSKVYNGLKNVLDDNGEKIGPGAGINLNGLAQRSGGTYGSNRSDGEYDNKNVQSTLHDVTYRLKVEGSDGYGSYADDYYFVEQAGGASVTQLVGKGEIKARPIDVEFFPANRQYDGTTAVDKGASGWGYLFKARAGDPQKDQDLVAQLLGNNPGDTAKDKPAGDNLQGNSTKFDATKITGNYVDEHGTPQSDVGIYKDRVKYEGIKNALLDGNYTIENIKMGSGEIKKRTFNAGDIDLAIGTATKVYDGTTLVKKDGDESRKQEYIQHFKMNLGGTVGWKDYALGTDYSLEGAAYDDPNVAANTASQPGKIQYKFSLKGSPLLKNYDFTNLPAGYELTGDTLTRTIKNNTITKRPVYAHVVNSNVTKTYNAKKNVIDESGATLSGDQLVTFDNVKNGVAQAEAGLIKKDNLGNATTASYTEKKVGNQNRTIDYTLALSGNSALFNNYELQDENGHATLTTHTNTINRRALRLKADEVTKEFDNTDVVKIGTTPSTTDHGLGYFNDSEDRQKDETNHLDVFSIAAGYTRKYNSPAATRTEESKKNNVIYHGIKLTGADAENYYLADSTGKNKLELDATTTDTNDFTMLGYGEITPLSVTANRFKLNFKANPIRKTYDGTANVGVGDATYNQPANLEGYIESAYVTKADGVTKLFDIGIEKVNSATYRTGVAAGSDGTADKNAADGKKVLFNLKFSDADRNNFDFDPSFYSGSAGADRMVHDAATNTDTYNVYTTGDIKKKDLHVEADGYVRKVYDKTANVSDIDEHLKLRDADIVKVDDKKDDVSLTGSSGVFKQGGNSVSNANIAPTDTNASGYDVAYTVQTAGADRGNYNFIRSDNNAALADGDTIDNAKGDIEKRKIYAKVVNEPFSKMYDGTGDVKDSDGNPAKGEALVRFGNKKADGTEIKNSGYLGDPADNATTAVYDGPNFDVGSDKNMTYTLAFTNAAMGSNYVFYDAKTGNPVTASQLHTQNNIINPAILNLITTGDPEKYYDGNRNVLQPQRYLKLVTASGGNAGISLTYTALYDNKNASRVKPDGTLERKKVSYTDITLGMGGQSAKNYTIRYGGKELESQGGRYNIDGQGIIKKRLIENDADLHMDFTSAKVQKTYDGTLDVPEYVKNNLGVYVRGPLRVSYTENGPQSIDMDLNLAKVLDAAYADKNVKRDAAGNVQGDKDVNFKFTLDGDNFDLSNLDQTKLQRGEETLDADGYRHYKYTYTRAAQNGQIDPRKVNLTVASVRKIYDGTANIGSNYYDADGNEKTDADFDVKNVIQYEKKNGDRGLLDGVGINSADLNGQYIDSNEALPSNDARDANRNIDGRFAAAKKVAYTIHLTGDDADNYAFVGSAMEANPLDGGRKTRVIGEGDIYQKKLSTEVRDTDRTYDGTTDAEAVQSHRSNVTLKTGVAGEDFQLDESAGRLLTAKYGDYDRNKGKFNPNANVKRNADGGVIARDVKYSNLKNALEDIKNRDAAVKAKAKNYFIEDRTYGKGTISPQHVTDVKEIWNGASFDKEYDRSKSAFMPESEKNRKFKDKLQLQLELDKKGGGKEVVSLDYDMYETGDKAPQYDTKNVARKADGSVADDKDVIYTLRGRRSLKDLMTYGAVNYDYEALNSYFYDGKDVHLKDDKNPNPTVKARITPRKVVAEPGYVTKVYDQTVNVPADKVKITPDKRSGELMAADGVGIKIDDAKFLDKNATADPGKAKEATAGKQVQYKLSLSNDGGNYSFTNGTTATESVGKGDIVRRKVHVEFDGRKDTPDKIYDTTDNVRNADGTQFMQKFRLKNDVADPHGDSGIFADEKAALDSAFTHKEYGGHFASSDVRRNPDGSIARQDAVYQGFGLRPDAIGNNYYIVESQDGYRDQNAAKITPRPIDVYIKDGNMRRQYDGTTNLADKFQAENNIVLMDRNPKIEGLEKPALPAWNAGDQAAYDSKDAGNRTVSYNPSWQDGNFVLRKGLKSANPNDPTSSLAEVRSLVYDAVAEDGTPLARDGIYGMRIAADGEISKRRLAVGTNDAWKVYDGTTGVNHAWNNLNFANVDENGNSTGEGAFASESEEQRAKNSLRASYDNADATGADTLAGALKRHNVNYRFEGADDVMGNYEFVNGTPAGGYSVDGAGFIKRRTLDVLSDWQAAYAGKGGVNYTGRIADGSVQTNEGSPLTPAVAADLQRFNSGVFTYGPMSGSADYSQPNWQEIQGWYTKNGVRTLARGEYERNYTLNPVPSRLFVAPRVDKVVPERTIRPDSKVYERAAFDESNAFGKSKDLNAALAYTGEGVNIGGTKPQQGTSTNASAAGIRQQGTGTNIGSSVGIGGAAGANGKVQGATGAANEAARVAGARPGANVKPQGAQSGAAVKPQGTTGGNAALAGGTAGQGGYYSPSAQPGASVKPQGAQSGAAVKPQGTTGGNAALAGGTAGQGGYYSPSAQPGASVKPQGAQSGVAVRPQGAASAVGSASSTVGAESVVDRGLAAAAGMSVGSSSDARTGASGSRRSADYSSGAGSYVDGSSRAADRGLANALGKGVGGAGYYSGKGYSHTNDDEEEEIKKKTKASA